MLQGPPDAAALNESAAAFGLRLVDRQGRPLAAEPAHVEVWAEHWPAVRLFGAMQTQYLRDPMGMRIGLNYAALPVVEQRLGLSRRQARAAFDALRVMEAEALRIFAERAAAAG